MRWDKNWTEVFWNPKTLLKWLKCQTCNHESLWKLVQRVTLLTLCKDTRLLKTTVQFTRIFFRMIKGWGRGLTKNNTNQIWAQTEWSINSTYLQNKTKKLKLSKIVFPLYEGQELSLSNCYFELKQ